MAQIHTEARPHFSQPIRQILLMLMVSALTGAGVFMALPTVLPVFEANPQLNGFIFFVFVIGVVACFWQIYQLVVSVRWLQRFTSDTSEVNTKAPQLLAPLASLLRSRGARMQINASSSRSILDSVATRIDEAREITRYIVNTLIFLGLLGTFYGLATTVPALVDTIRGLAPQDGESGTQIFGRLMSGLEAQLSGMGVAFASSLLGLAGSLLVGILELFAGHGQNRFYRELEEWLSTITRVGFSTGEDASADQQAMAGVLEHMSEQMESLQQISAQSEANQERMYERMELLSESIERMIQQMQHGDAENSALERVAAGQERLITHLAQNSGSDGGLDAESRMRLRSIDVQMLRILEELSAGRQESMIELRTDISALAQAFMQSRTGQQNPQDKG